MDRERANTMTMSRALLSGLVDYAGLFPPSALTMVDAVERFSAHLLGGDSWMLGRFVVPAHRLVEFASVRAAAGVHDHAPWRLTALLGQSPNGDVEAVSQFNNVQRTVCPAPFGIVDVCEVKVDDAAAVALAAGAALDGLRMVYEVGPVPEQWADVLEAIRAVGGVAKFRTGGLVPAAVPDVATLASFICRCVSSRVPFKLTAGLHRAMRSERALTYEAASPVAMTHGFLNVFVATAVVRQSLMSGADEAAARSLAEAALSETDAGMFQIDASAVRWRHVCVTADELAVVRETVALSFGSCSFDEPIAEVRALWPSVFVRCPGDVPL